MKIKSFKLDERKTELMQTGKVNAACVLVRFSHYFTKKKHMKIIEVITQNLERNNHSFHSFVYINK